MSNTKIISNSAETFDVTYYQQDQLQQVLQNATTSVDYESINCTKNELDALLAIVAIQREIRSLLNAFSEEQESFVGDYQDIYDKISDVRQNIIPLNKMLRELKTKILKNKVGE